MEMLERFNPALLDALLRYMELAASLAQSKLQREVMADDALREAMKQYVGQAEAGLQSLKSRADYDRVLRAFAVRLRECDMPMSAAAVLQLADDLKCGGFKERDLLVELGRRAKDELGLLVFLQIPKARLHYLNSGELFGAAVTEAFPTASTDIDEAGHCLAVGLYTACVFHLMRAMEAALRTLAKMLDVPDPTGGDRNWSKMLDNFYDKIKERDAAKYRWAAGERQYFTGAHGLLDGVRIAWRNECMHLDAKYDEADALRIFHAVNGFMGHLAKLPKKQGVVDADAEG